MSSNLFRLSCLVTMVMILLGSHVSFTSSAKLPARIHKRDANCPGGLRKRDQALLERLSAIYPSSGIHETQRRSEGAGSFDRLDSQARSSIPRSVSSDDAYALLKSLSDSGYRR